MSPNGPDRSERETATARLDGRGDAADHPHDSEQLATEPLKPNGANTADEARDAAELAIGTLIGGRYELLRRVAGGSMGVVYKALDRQRTLETGEPAWVAVKVLTPRLDRHGPALRALQREAETGLLLDHPNVVRFYGLGRDGSRFYIVMEWLPGSSLADWLDRRPDEPMPADDVLHIVRSIGAALAHAHERGVVHADVKPGNVMLLPDGTVRLCDFGIARLDRVLATGTGTFDPGVLKAATPAYSSPEVLNGETPTVRDDVYSLACLAYRMLSGHRVFGSLDALEAEAAGESPRRIQGLAECSWQALAAALAYSRYERPADVQTFLDRFAPDGTGRRRRAFALLAVLVAAAAAGVLWLTGL